MQKPLACSMVVCCCITKYVVSDSWYGIVVQGYGWILWHYKSFASFFSNLSQDLHAKGHHFHEARGQKRENKTKTISPPSAPRLRFYVFSMPKTYVFIFFRTAKKNLSVKIKAGRPYLEVRVGVIQKPGLCERYVYRMQSAPGSTGRPSW